MRRVALLFAGATIWLFLFAIPAMADNGPHVKGQNSTSLQGSCAGCHRAHSAQAPNLVKTAQPTLCYSCHGAGGAGASTDAQDGVFYSDPAATHAGTLGVGGGVSVGGSALRGGGFEYALIDTNPSGGVTGDSNRTIGVLSSGAATTSSHSVDGTAVTMWGSGALGTAGVGKTSVALTCASCHDPHGNGQYRILKPGPDDSNAVDAAAGFVKINDATTKVYYTTNYGVLGEVASDLNNPLNADGSSVNYDTATKTYTGTFLETSSRWCATCHTRYMSYAGSAGNKTWTEAGTTDSVYKYRHAVRNIVDPATNGATGLTGVINPISAYSQLKAGATLGSYTSSGTSPTAYSYLNRGVAVSGTGSGLSSATAAGDLLTASAPKCITCHVAHGSDAAVGTFATGGSSLVTGTLDSALLRLDGRGVCQNCHKK